MSIEFHVFSCVFLCFLCFVDTRKHSCKFPDKGARPYFSPCKAVDFMIARNETMLDDTVTGPVLRTRMTPLYGTPN